VASAPALCVCTFGGLALQSLITLGIGSSTAGARMVQPAVGTLATGAPRRSPLPFTFHRDLLVTV